MRKPKVLEEISEFFPVQNKESRYLTYEESLRGVAEIYFPPRTIPYPIVLAYLAAGTLEAMIRNRPRHYGKPGEIKPMSRLCTFDKVAPAIKHVKEGRATHKALAQVYNHRFGVLNKDTLTEKIEALFLDLTFNTDHALGLLGRYLIAKRVLENVLSSGKIKNFASIACGAGGAVIHGLDRARKLGIDIKTGFFDINNEALQIAEEEAGKKGLQSNVQCFLLNVIKRLAWFNALPFDGIELIGIIDYIPDDFLVKFLRSLRNPRLKFLLSCNILKKPRLRGWCERLFVYYALQWPMYYRTPEELKALFHSAGYENIQLIKEPNNLFSVIVWINS